MAAGPRLGSTEPREKTGLRLSPQPVTSDNLLYKLHASLSLQCLELSVYLVCTYVVSIVTTSYILLTSYYVIPSIVKYTYTIYFYSTYYVLIITSRIEYYDRTIGSMS